VPGKIEFKTDKAPRAFDLPRRESEAFDAMAKELDLSPSAALTWAIRIAHTVHERAKRGKPIDMRDPDLPPLMAEPPDVEF
jgi:hypothetical protein